MIAENTEAENVEDQRLLLYAKEGNSALIQKLLQARMNQSTQSKSTPGWTALHLASSFGYREVVEELLQAGADVNLQESLGDTPLHKAAQSGRKVSVHPFIAILCLVHNCAAGTLQWSIFVSPVMLDMVCEGL
uniref:Uncharacterized protein n=1 Tax=Oryzias melastigma TaxID=30732 RepID=A0A3B3D2K8_ORYME